MKSPRFSGVVVCTLAVLFLALGCAVLTKRYTQVHYETFELMFNGQKTVVNLPDELPSMHAAVFKDEGCFNAEVCRLQFCLDAEPGHDHVDFVFVGAGVIGLVWIKTAEIDFERKFLAWIYIEGKPVSVSVYKLKKLIRGRDSKVAKPITFNYVELIRI